MNKLNTDETNRIVKITNQFNQWIQNNFPAIWTKKEFDPAIEIVYRQMQIAFKAGHRHGQDEIK